MKKLTKEKRQEFLDILTNKFWAINAYHECPSHYGLNDNPKCGIDDYNPPCSLCWIKALKESLGIRYENH